MKHFSEEAPIRFVYFDVGGTLLHPHPSVGAVYAEAGRPFDLRATASALDAAFLASYKHRIAETGAPAFGRTLASTRAFWQDLVFEVLDEVGFGGPKAPCFDAIYRAFESPEAWHVDPDVWPVFRSLQDRNIPMGVLSNWDVRLPRLLESLGMQNCFQVLILSANEGVAKPDPEIFQRAADAAGMPPNAILHVGDHVDLDIQPAQRAGFQTFRVDLPRSRLSDVLSLLPPG
jgi:putative hydrolase of the HAD superfamily